MKIKTLGIMAGVGGAALGAVVTGIGANIIVNCKNKEIESLRKENIAIKDSLDTEKASGILESNKHIQAIQTSNEELEKASKAISESMDTINKQNEKIKELKKEVKEKQDELSSVEKKWSDKWNKDTESISDDLNKIARENKKLKEMNKKLEEEVADFNKKLAKFKDIEDAMKAAKEMDQNITLSKAKVLEADKKQKSVAKKISKK